MDEIGPGIFHWTAEHPETGGTAHSHLIAEAATVLDPMASRRRSSCSATARPSGSR